MRPCEEKVGYDMNSRGAFKMGGTAEPLYECKKTIHCCISGYNDIISKCSAKDQESLNFNFVDYLKDLNTKKLNSLRYVYEN